jgi:hypothetical protein
MSTVVRPRRASGRWLAPTLLAIAVAIGGTGVWYALHSRPTPGAYYEVFALDANTAVALRHEVGSERSFVELVELGRGVHWQALIPPYAGRPGAPGLAASTTAITVRVRRAGKDELWALSTNDAEKLGQVELRPGADAPHATPPAVVTVGDRTQSFELVGDASHTTAVTAIELASGKAQWRVDLGPDPIAYGWLDEHTLWIRIHGGGVFGLDRATGARQDASGPGGDGVTLRGIAARALAAHVEWPADAAPFRPYHEADGTIWMIRGDHLEAYDARTGARRGSVGD